MAALVVIAGITGASSAAHAAVFFAPAGASSDVVICAADKWLLSPLVPLILRFLSYMRVQSS